MSRHRRPIVALIAGAVMLLAACGGSDGTSSGDGSGSGAEGDGTPTAAGAEYAPELELRPLVLLTPTEGAGERPVFEWEPVEDAALYTLVLLDADGNGYWSWQGDATEIPLGGEPRLEDGIEGPLASAGMSWSVSAQDADGNVLALSEFRSISP